MPVTDAQVLIIALLVFVYMVFVLIGIEFGFRGDHLLWLNVGFIAAGMVMIFLSTAAWETTSSLYTSLAIAMLGIVTISYPVTTMIQRMLE